MSLVKLSNSLIDRDTLGKGISFPLTIDANTKDFVKVAYEENVKECIYWLISTRVGERIMNEDVGTLVNASIFEDMEVVADVVPFQIAEAIAKFEPRVENVRVKAEQTSLTELRVTVIWTVRATGRVDNLVYPYYTQPNGGAL